MIKTKECAQMSQISCRNIKKARIRSKIPIIVVRTLNTLKRVPSKESLVAFGKINRIGSLIIKIIALAPPLLQIIAMNPTNKRPILPKRARNGWSATVIITPMNDMI